MIPLLPRFSSRNGRQLRFQNNIVNSPLLSTKTPIYGKSSRNVGRVALEFTASVDKDEVSILHLCIVFRVVKTTGVLTTTDNGVIGRKARAVLRKTVLNRGLQMVFITTRATLTHRAAVSLSTDISCPLHDAHLRLRLNQSMLMK